MDEEYEGIGAFDIENRFKMKIKTVEDDKDDLILLLFNGKDLMGLLRKGGRLTIVMQLKPETPAPPAEIPRYVGDNICERCGWPLHDDPKDGCTKDNCSMRPMPPKPAEMPEVDLHAKSISQPFIRGTFIGFCHAWTQKMGDKEPNTCDGCKIAGCAAKGRIKTE